SEIVADLDQGRLVQLLVTNWPTPELNHTVVAFAYRWTDTALQLTVWDPNDPTEPGLITFERPARQFVATRVYDTRPGAIRHFGICFADLVVANRQRQLPERLLAAIRGSEYLDEAGAARRGLVVLTAHLGNWEFAGRLLAHRAPRATHVVVAPEADAAVERFLRGAPGAVNFVTR